jgi:predicted dehydrogenase
MDRALRFIAVGFDHMHIGDQLALALQHPQVEVVGAFDSSVQRMTTVLNELNLNVPTSQDLDQLVRAVEPDVALVCSTTEQHADVVVRLAGAGVHCLLEKPFGDSLDAVKRMIDASTVGGGGVFINWPLAWYPTHRTAQRLISEGAIGRVEQVHFYDGNRGPLRHGHAKVELDEKDGARSDSWWYSKSAGGGSLRDYLGYGVTLGLWFRSGELPNRVTSSWHVPEGMEVDEQSVTVAHYNTGLSVFETRWGTGSDPWTRQPQPRCGFVINGSQGSISTWDFDDGVTLQRDDESSERIALDSIAAEDTSAIANLVAHLSTGRVLDPPMTAQISARGQVLVEAAVLSAESGSTISLAEVTDNEWL